jgi:hypothetical protein
MLTPRALPSVATLAHPLSPGQSIASPTEVRAGPSGSEPNRAVNLASRDEEPNREVRA